ncbi:hypothetical protein QIS74_11587 [Colletotrichum tabaci]|uniref:Uncharacterized protein n=1 Tax=Colletotrichum tabaci TaxID=1209068 RepID=A0AAV9SYC4_9PEZI
MPDAQRFKDSRLEEGSSFCRNGGEVREPTTSFNQSFELFQDHQPNIRGQNCPWKLEASAMSMAETAFECVMGLSTQKHCWLENETKGVLEVEKVPRAKGSYLSLAIKGVARRPAL